MLHDRSGHAIVSPLPGLLLDMIDLVADIRVCCSRNSREGANLPSYLPPVAIRLGRARILWQNTDIEIVKKGNLDLDEDIFGKMNFSLLTDVNLVFYFIHEFCISN